MDRRTRPERIAAVLRDIDADVIALQEVIGAGPAGGSHIEEIGAALGMGWVMAPTRRLRGHHFGNAILSRYSDLRAHRTRPLVPRLRGARHAARRHRPWAAIACTSTTCTSARRSSSAATRRAASRRSSPTATCPGPKIVLGDFNEWMKGLTTTPPELEAQKRRSGQLSEAAPHISRPFPHPASRPHLLCRASGNRRNQPRSD